MKKLLFFGLIAFTVAACKKDKFETVPKVEITSFGPDEVTKGQLFRLTATVTDKEGDLQDSLILVRKRYTNDILFRTDTTKYSLKEFGIPNEQTFELSLTFGYGEDIPGTIFYSIQESIDRGVTYGIIITDKAKNKSTYVESKKILLKKV